MNQCPLTSWMCGSTPTPSSLDLLCDIRSSWWGLTKSAEWWSALWPHQLCGEASSHYIKSSCKLKVEMFSDHTRNISCLSKEGNTGLAVLLLSHHKLFPWIIAWVKEYQPYKTFRKCLKPPYTHILLEVRNIKGLLWVLHWTQWEFLIRTLTQTNR